MSTTEASRTRLVGANIPFYERLLSIGLGSAAVLFGLRRRSPLGSALAAAGAPLLARGLLGRSLVYRQLGARKGIEVKRAVTIQRPRSEVYQMWRRLENLPRFMEHVQQVVVEDDRVSHWMIEEGRVSLQWMAEIVEDIPDRRLAWRSIPGGDVDNEGMIELRDAPGDRGTEVHVAIQYRPPGGILVSAALGALLRKFTSFQLDAELTRLRQLMETGELATGAAHRDDRTEVERKVESIQGSVPASLAPPPISPSPAPSRTTPLRGGV